MMTPQERQAELRALLGSVRAAPESAARVREASNDIDTEALHRKQDLSVRQEKQALRRKWDKMLGRLVIAGFFISYGLITLIGLGWLKFDAGPFAVPTVVAAAILQTYGLAKLAVKFIFSEDPERPKKR